MKRTKKKEVSEAEPEKNRKIPTWLMAVILSLWAVGVMVVTQVIIGLIFRWIIPKHMISAPWVNSLYILISDLLSVFIILFVPYRHKKHSLRKDLGLLDLPKWSDLIIAPVGYFVYLLLSYLLFRIFSVFPWFNPEQTQNLGYNYSLLFGGERIFALIVLLVIVPIIEEVVFRGFLYGKLKKLFLDKCKKSKKLESKASMIAIIAAILIVSVVFGAMHGQWNVGVDVFAMSVILCLMREITDSIYPGILVHILKNTLAFFVLSTMFY